MRVGASASASGRLDENSVSLAVVKALEAFAGRTAWQQSARLVVKAGRHPAGRGIWSDARTR